MGDGINIPEWKALDFSGLGGIADAYLAGRKQKTDEQDKETQRKYVENQDRKLSADMARQAWEDQHKLDLETSKELLPGSDFWRAAQMSAGLGNQVGAPYGISVGEDKKVQLPADNTTPSDAAAAQFLKGGAQPQAPLQGPTPSGKPLPEADQKNAELLSFAPPTQPDAAPGAPAATAAPALGDLDALAAEKESQLPVTRSVYATVRGQRIEPPKEIPADFFPEPEYNAMVQKLVATGKFDDASAVKQVEAVRKADIGEGGRNSRFNAGLGQKQDTQLTREERIKMQQDALGVSRQNSVGRDQAILGSATIRAGAGASGGLPALSKEQGIAQNALNQRIARIQSISAWQKLVESEKSADLLLHDVESGAVPLQNREAQVLAAKIIRGRVTNEEMHQLYDNIGGASDLLQRLASNTGMGELSPEQLSQLRTSVQVLLNQDRQMRLRAQNVARQGLHAFGGVMPGEAQDSYEMLMTELGLPAEQLFGAEGAPSQGAPSAPSSGPAPQRAPAAGGGGGHDKAVTWARAHKGDPRAKRILELHGLSE